MPYSANFRIGARFAVARWIINYIKPLHLDHKLIYSRWLFYTTDITVTCGRTTRSPFAATG